MASSTIPCYPKHRRCGTSAAIYHQNELEASPRNFVARPSSSSTSSYNHPHSPILSASSLITRLPASPTAALLSHTHNAVLEIITDCKQCSRQIYVNTHSHRHSFCLVRLRRRVALPPLGLLRSRADMLRAARRRSRAQSSVSISVPPTRLLP